MVTEELTRIEELADHLERVQATLGPNVPDVILTVATAEYWTDDDDPVFGPDDMGLDMDREEWATALRVLQQANLVKGFGGYREANREAGLAALHHWYPETRPEPVEVDDLDSLDPFAHLDADIPPPQEGAPETRGAVEKTPPRDEGGSAQQPAETPLQRMQAWLTAVIAAAPNGNAMRLAAALSIRADSRTMTGYVTSTDAIQNFGFASEEAVRKARRELERLGFLADTGRPGPYGRKIWELTNPPS